METNDSTTPVRAGMQLDVPRLSTYLALALPEIRQPFELRQFKFGQSNPTYLLIGADHKRYVLRKKPPGKLISKKAHAIEREHKVINAVGTLTDVPVPRAYLLCEDDSIIGTPFYIMEFLDGRIFTELVLDSVPDRDIKRTCFMAVVDTLARLHRASPSRLGLLPPVPQQTPSGKRAPTFYERQMATLVAISKAQGAIVNVDTNEPVGDIPRLDDMIAWFKANQVPDDVAIVHGDFKVDNVVFHPVSPRVIGVLDWELSTVGNPLSDLANLLLLWYTPTDMQTPGGFGFQGAPRPLVIPEAEDLLKEYCRLMGRPYPIAKFSFCIAFSFFRLCVIAQGISARVALKQASSEDAYRMASQYKTLSKLVLSYVDAGNLESTPPSSKL